MAKAKKSPGRPPGSINDKSAYPRDETGPNFRCSRGFNEVVAELVRSGHYKSKADVLHRALEILAARHLPGEFYWRDKIQ